MKLINSVPYIYTFTNEVQTAITLVNHYTRQCKYFTAEHFKVCMSALSDVAQRELDELILIYEDTSFNYLTQEVDPFTEIEYYQLTLDAPNSQLPSAVLKFSCISRLVDIKHDRSMFDLISSRCWTVLLDSEGTPRICTYNINPYEPIEYLDDFLLNSSTHTIDYLEGQFDLREYKYRITSIQMMKQANHFSQSTKMPYDFILKLLIQKEEEEKKQLSVSSSTFSTPVLSVENITDLLKEFEHEDMYQHILSTCNVTSRESGMHLVITARSFYKGVFNKKNYRIKKTSDVAFIEEKTQECKRISSAKTYITYNIRYIHIQSTIPEFIGHYYNLQMEEFEHYLHKYPTSEKYYVYMIYKWNDRIRPFLIIRRLKSKVYECTLKLLAKKFYLIKTYDKFTKIDPTLFEDIYVHQGTTEFKDRSSFFVSTDQIDT